MIQAQIIFTMRNILTIAILTLSLANSVAQTSKLSQNICANKEDQKKSIIDIISNHTPICGKDEQFPYIYKLEVDNYVRDSILSIHLSRISNQSKFVPKLFNGLVKTDFSFFVVVLSGKSNLFIKDFGIDSLTREAIEFGKNNLFDDSRHLASCKIDEFGSWKWKLDFNLKKNTYTQHHNGKLSPIKPSEL